MTVITRWYAMRGTQAQFCTISAMDDYIKKEGPMKPYYFISQNFLGNWNWELRAANHRVLLACGNSFSSKKAVLENINKIEAVIKAQPECKGEHVA